MCTKAHVCKYKTVPQKNTKLGTLSEKRGNVTVSKTPFGGNFTEGMMKGRVPSSRHVLPATAEEAFVVITAGWMSGGELNRRLGMSRLAAQRGDEKPLPAPARGTYRNLSNSCNNWCPVKTHLSGQDCSHRFFCLQTCEWKRVGAVVHNRMCVRKQKLFQLLKHLEEVFNS